MVKYLKNMGEYNALSAECGAKLLVIDFTASWCPPCKMIAPHFDQLAQENPDATFVKVDVDDAADIASHFGISAMPTFKFVKSGEVVGELQGADITRLKTLVASKK